MKRRIEDEKGFESPGVRTHRSFREKIDPFVNLVLYSLFCYATLTTFLYITAEIHHVDSFQIQNLYFITPRSLIIELHSIINIIELEFRQKKVCNYIISFWIKLLVTKLKIFIELKTITHIGMMIHLGRHCLCAQLTKRSTNSELRNKTRNCSRPMIIKANVDYVISHHVTLLRVSNICTPIQVGRGFISLLLATRGFASNSTT